MGITGPIIDLHDQLEEMRDSILDGVLDPEYLVALQDAYQDSPSEELLDYLRKINTLHIAYQTWGDEFLSNLGLDSTTAVR